MARDEQALHDVVEHSAAILTAAGFPKMPARVLMALTASEAGGLTAQELSEQLGASAAAISGAVRYLQTIGIVRRLSQNGSRRDRYELPENAWYGALATESPIYGVLAAQGDAGVAAIDDPSSVGSARLAEMARFYRFLERRMPQLLEEWEAERRIPE
ncbi:GbsR/MarR family transcriptional regulator [Diaminobutyricibacter sp. McL0618]|jgi:biotin operon repressor|uniref:GbsR/MarR family transcriptional regulator n=1 Tax=Leifsonia sp. McL0618 TaxID=3415677 RepID=UPI003CFB5530